MPGETLETLYVQIEAKLDQLNTQLVGAESTAKNSASKIENSFGKSFERINGFASKLGSTMPDADFVTKVNHITSALEVMANETKNGLITQNEFRAGLDVTRAALEQQVQKLDKADTSYAATVASLTAVNAQLKDLDKALSSSGSNWEQLASNVKKSSNEVAIGVKSLGQYKAQLDTTSAALTAEINVLDKSSDAYANAVSTLKDVRAESDRVDSALLVQNLSWSNLGETVKTKFSEGVQQGGTDAINIVEEMGKKWGALATPVGLAGAAAGLATAGAAALVAQMVIATDVAQGFESALDGASSVLKASSEDTERLGLAAKTLGSDLNAGAIGATNTAAVIEQLGSSGLETADIIGGGLKAALVTAAATGVTDFTKVAEVVAGTKAAFGGVAADLPRVADLITNAMNVSQLKVDSFSQALAAGGSAAKSTGTSLIDFTSIISLMSDRLISGSDAGTSFKSFMAALSPSSSEAAKEIKKLNLEFYDSTGKMKSLEEITKLLTTAYSGMTQKQRDSSAETIFGSDGIRVFNTLLDVGVQGLQKRKGALEQVGSADEASAVRMKNAEGAQKRLDAAVENFNITLGTKLLPLKTGVLNFLADLATGFTNTIDPAQRAAKAMLEVADAAGKLGLVKPDLVKAQMADLEKQIAGTKRGLESLRKSYDANQDPAILAEIKVQETYLKGLEDQYKSLAKTVRNAARENNTESFGPPKPKGSSSNLTVTPIPLLDDGFEQAVKRAGELQRALDAARKSGNALKFDEAQQALDEFTSSSEMNARALEAYNAVQGRTATATKITTAEIQKLIPQAERLELAFRAATPGTQGYEAAQLALRRFTEENRGGAEALSLVKTGLDDVAQAQARNKSNSDQAKQEAKRYAETVQDLSLRLRDLNEKYNDQVQAGKANSSTLIEYRRDMRGLIEDAAKADVKFGQLNATYRNQVAPLEASIKAQAAFSTKLEQTVDAATNAIKKGGKDGLEGAFTSLNALIKDKAFLGLDDAAKNQAIKAREAVAAELGKVKGFDKFAQAARESIDIASKVIGTGDAGLMAAQIKRLEEIAGRADFSKLPEALKQAILDKRQEIEDAVQTLIESALNQDSFDEYRALRAAEMPAVTQIQSIVLDVDQNSLTAIEAAIETVRGKASDIKTEAGQASFDKALAQLERMAKLAPDVNFEGSSVDLGDQTGVLKQAADDLQIAAGAIETAFSGLDQNSSVGDIEYSIETLTLALSVMGEGSTQAKEDLERNLDSMVQLLEAARADAETPIPVSVVKLDDLNLKLARVEAQYKNGSLSASEYLDRIAELQNEAGDLAGAFGTATEEGARYEDVTGRLASASEAASAMLENTASSINQANGALEEYTGGIDATTTAIADQNDIREEERKAFQASLDAAAEYQATIQDLAGTVGSVGDATKELIDDLAKGINTLKATGASTETILDELGANVNALENRLNDVDLAPEFGSEEWFALTKEIERLQGEIAKLKPPSGFIQITPELTAQAKAFDGLTSSLEGLSSKGSRPFAKELELIKTLLKDPLVSPEDIAALQDLQAGFEAAAGAEGAKALEAAQLALSGVMGETGPYDSQIAGLEALKETYPELADEIDKIIGKYGELAGEAGPKALAQAQLELASVLGQTEPYDSQLKNLDELKKKYPELADEIDKLIGKYQQLTKLAKLSSDVGKGLDAFNKGLDSLKDFKNGDVKSGLEGILDTGATIAGFFGPEGKMIGDMVAGIGKAAIAVFDFFQSLDRNYQNAKALEELNKQAKELAKGFQFIGEESAKAFTSIESKSRGWLSDFLFGPELSVKIDEFGVKIAKTLEGGVASGLKNGLNAKTWDEGLAIFRKDLGQSVIDSLIEGFMKSEAIKGVIGPAVATLAKALSDGDPTNDDAALAAFDQATAKIVPAFKKFYDGLGKVRDQFGLGEKSLVPGSLTAYQAQMAALQEKFNKAGSSSERNGLKTQIDAVQRQIDAINNGGLTVTPNVPMPTVTTVQLPNISANVQAIPEWQNELMNGIASFNGGVIDFNRAIQQLLAYAQSGDNVLARELRFLR